LEDARVVATGEHLIVKELADRERVKMGEVEDVLVVGQSQVLGEERLRQKSKRRMLVGGGAEEEMDVD